MMVDRSGDEDIYICDKCGNYARHGHLDSNGPTLHFCDKCEEEYQQMLKDKTTEFLGKQLL